jgi:hypothetical protein
MKRCKRDTVFSQLVRERSNWTCERCGCYVPEGERQRLHCSHIVSRKYRRLRWEPINAVAHCAMCHSHLTDRPHEFGRWVDETLGRSVSDRLSELSQPIGKYSKPQLEDIYQNLKASLKQIQMQRADGETGRLDFESPYEQ